jgi:hypothetical protein
MKLVRDEGLRGLWRAPGIPAGTAGVHAMIVGISDYPFLEGGTTPRPGGSAGMGQLAVSASGAAQIFRWLGETGRFAGRPVMTCRVLLAPGKSKGKDGSTETEYVEAITGGWHGDPTFANFRDLVVDWANEFFQTPARLRAETAALFFYSGHGLEVFSSPALLARDILDTRRAAGESNAVAYRSILDALPTYGLGDALFLFDCCRNAPGKARELNIVGQSVLTPSADPAAAPRSSMWLKAAEGRLSAYQDPKSARRASLFAQAVLEALEGFPPDFKPYDRSAAPWRLLFEDLESFSGDRVRELLRKRNSSKTQTVVPGGDPYRAKTMVAERDPPEGASLADPSDSLFKSDTGPPPPPPRKDAQELIEERGRAVVNRFSTEVREGGRATRTNRDVGDLVNLDVMREVLLHKTYARPWVDLVSILDGDTAQPVDRWSVALVGGRLSERDQLAWIDIRLSPGLGERVWISLDAANWPGKADAMPNSLGVLLPRDRLSPVTIRLECTFGAVDACGLAPPIGLTARLAPPSTRQEMWEIWAQLFNAQRDAALYSLAEGVRKLSTSAFQMALEAKVESPLGAAIGAAMLLAADELAKLRDWPRNLANWFPQLGDGPILWSETIFRRQREEGYLQVPLELDATPGPKARSWWNKAETREALEMFARLQEHGPPILTPVLEMALRQADVWESYLPHVEDPELVDKLRRSVDLVRRAADLVQQDTLFLSFQSAGPGLMPPDVYAADRRGVAVEA